jgi:hypothetical protein
MTNNQTGERVQEGAALNTVDTRLVTDRINLNARPLPGAQTGIQDDINRTWHDQNYGTTSAFWEGRMAGEANNYANGMFNLNNQWAARAPYNKMPRVVDPAGSPAPPPAVPLKGPGA